MANFNEYSGKGEKLMKEALELYKEGDFEKGDKLREKANEYFDLASAEINSDAGKLTQLYGESRNFGVIYNVFEDNLLELLKRKNGKQVVKEFYDTIKSDKILNEQFKVYDAFENLDDEELVKESIELIHTFNKDKVREANEKLVEIFKKNNINEFVEIPEEKENLYEAIEYIMLNKRSFNNIGNFIKSEKVITEHIKNNNKKNISENLNFDAFMEKIEESSKEFDLNEEEKKLFQNYMNTKIDNKELFENIKKDTLERLEETISKSEENDKNDWQTIKEDVTKMQYDEDDCFVQCAKLMEIKGML